MPNEDQIATAAVLAEDQQEFITLSVIRIEEDFFLLNANGGERGAWQNGKDKCEIITRAQARAMLLEMGKDALEALELTS